MSEVDTNSGASPCDQLLEFVYGELDEANKRAFETHLAGCTRCQAEAASFGRSREAARRVMPMVEPPATMTGALHAQLLHAASQRRPKRGVVLQLFRRVAQHPQLAAAAMFVIVGGAFVFSWHKGKVFPAVSELASPATPVADTPKPTESKTGEEGGEVGKLAANQPGNGIQLPAGATTKFEAKADDSRQAYGKRAELKSLEKNKEQAPEAMGSVDGKLVLQTAPAQYNVDSPAQHHAAAAAPPKAMRAVAKDAARSRDTYDGLGGLGMGGKADDNGGGADLDGVADRKTNAPARGAALADGNSAPAERNLRGGGPSASHAASDKSLAVGNANVVGGKGGGSGAVGGMLARNDSAKSSAPSTTRASKESRERLSQGTSPPLALAPSATVSPSKPRPQLQAESEQSTVPSAAPAPVVSAGDAESGYAQQYKTTPAKKPAAPPMSAEVQRKRFDDLARSNRCDEAIRVFQELERATQHISPSERAQYVRCLSAAGRQQQAEEQLLELKSDKKASTAEVQKLQNEIDGTRPKQRRAEKKKSAMPAPADDRASDQQAREAPAQAAPAAAPAQKPAQQQQQQQDRNSSKAAY